jgi:RNA polymerase sigma factor (sigma-70 family)
MDTLVRHLRRAVLRQEGVDRTDGQLVAAFIDHKDDAAFEALVRRHGPMVFGVCRRVVGNHHDAEDAFQATFLILARKASSVRPRERVANWLHGVALRTALKAKALTAKLRGREKQLAEMPEAEAAQESQWRDLQPLLDQELNGLPENYRLPILLCDLEGKAIKEAAQQLGWPQGTLSGRLARGRKLLAKRLSNRGVELSAGSLVAVISENVASAGVSTSLASSTIKAAILVSAGQGVATGAISGKVAVLTQGVLNAMLMHKLKGVIAVLLAVAVLTSLGAGLVNSCTVGEQNENKKDERLTFQTEGNPSARNDGEDETDARLPRKEELPTPRSEMRVAVLPGRYSAIYEKTLGVLSDHFKIDHANRYEGRIETCAAFVNLTPDVEGEKEPTLRRRAVARITALSEGEFAVEVIVLRERRAAGPANPFAEVQWEAAGRDTECERELLAHIEKGVAVEPPRPRPLQPAGPMIVIVPNARIVIAPGERIRVTPVKSASGGRVRLELEGITIEVPRLTIETNGKTTHLEASAAGDAVTSRTFSTTEVKEIGLRK